MKTEKITLKNETGLHARPASEIVKIASKYQNQYKKLLNQTFFVLILLFFPF